MQNYVDQLLSDINECKENLTFSNASKELSLNDWISDEEENKTAPVRELEEWTGIRKEMLPAEQLLSDDQVSSLLSALIKLLDACNCCFVLQTQVAERIQYETVRQNFDQQIKLKRWHMGFFAFCKPGTEHKKCAMAEYCQCAFYEEFFSGFIDEDLSPEEKRARALEIELQHIKRKYEDDWMKFYPYHLDKNYDDENGNPYNYGFEDGNEEEDNDDWWKK